MAVRAGLAQGRTTQQVLEQYGAEARSFFIPKFQRAGITWPPKKIQLIALKQERVLEVWAANATGKYAFIHAFDVLAMSGVAGVKRQEGDRQVPEGFYMLTGLNPNSQFHLSIKINYPNATDDTNATSEKQGGDIFIHGSNVSVGCIAIGDDAIEKLFCLVAQTPAQDRRILIAPCDFRKGKKQTADAPWVERLYKQLAHKMKEFAHPDGD